MRDRLPPSVLAALGLLSSCQSCDPPQHPCLSIVEQPDQPPSTIPEVPLGACLEPLPVLGPCLKPAMDPPLQPCLSVVAPRDRPTTVVHPCLSPPPMHPCLSIALPDPPVQPCLEYVEPPHKCLSKAPDPPEAPVAPCLSEAPISPCLDVNPEGARSVERPSIAQVLRRGVLPDDVVARLKKRG